MKKILFLFGIFLAVAVGLYFAKDYVAKMPAILDSKETSAITINGHSFKVTEVSSQKDLEIGLSETKSISSDQGMLFIFEEASYYSFWMKNMKFPIDIIYINQDAIVTIRNNAQPPKNNTDNLVVYFPEKPSNKVLEIQAGLAEKYGFKIGDKVTYENSGS